MLKISSKGLLILFLLATVLILSCNGSQSASFQNSIVSKSGIGEVILSDKAKENIKIEHSVIKHFDGSSPTIVQITVTNQSMEKMEINVYGNLYKRYYIWVVSTDEDGLPIGNTEAPYFKTLLPKEITSAQVKLFNSADTKGYKIWAGYKSLPQIPGRYIESIDARQKISQPKFYIDADDRIIKGQPNYYVAVEVTNISSTTIDSFNNVWICRITYNYDGKPSQIQEVSLAGMLNPYIKPGNTTSIQCGPDIFTLTNYLDNCKSYEFTIIQSGGHGSPPASL